MKTYHKLLMINNHKKIYHKKLMFKIIMMNIVMKINYLKLIIKEWKKQSKDMKIS